MSNTKLFLKFFFGGNYSYCKKHFTNEILLNAELNPVFYMKIPTTLITTEKPSTRWSYRWGHNKQILGIKGWKTKDQIRINGAVQMRLSRPESGSDTREGQGNVPVLGCRCGFHVLIQTAFQMSIARTVRSIARCWLQKAYARVWSNILMLVQCMHFVKFKVYSFRISNKPYSILKAAWAELLHLTEVRRRFTHSVVKSAYYVHKEWNSFAIKNRK